MPSGRLPPPPQDRLPFSAHRSAPTARRCRAPTAPLPPAWSRPRRIGPLAATTIAAVLGAGCSPLIYVFVGEDEAVGIGSIGVAQTISSRTDGAANEFSLSCVEDGADQSWVFVPAVSDTYRVHVDASYDAAVAVFGSMDDSDELACNDDHDSTSSSEVTLPLEAGETYAIVVDGYDGATGSYSLIVEQATAAPPPSDGPPQPIPTTGPSDDPQTMASLCAQAPTLAIGRTQGTLPNRPSAASLSCGGFGPGAEVLYRIVVDVPSQLHVAEESDFDAVLELRRGCTNGHQVIACVDDSPDVRHAIIDAAVAPGEYHLIVDSYAASAGGPFTLDTSLVPTGGPIPRRKPSTGDRP